MPFIPILLAIGGVTLAASLFATWFDVTRVAFSGFEQPSLEQVSSLSQTGWDFWDGGDVALFALGIALAALALYDAARHEVPHRALAIAGFVCLVALVVVVAEGFGGDTVTLVEGELGENAGEARIVRDRAGGQWVALIGLLVALAGIALGWRERRPRATTPPERAESLQL